MPSQLPSRREAKRLKELTGKDPVDIPMPDAEPIQDESLQKKFSCTFPSNKLPRTLTSTPMEGIESSVAGEISQDRSKLHVSALAAPDNELSPTGEDEAVVVKAGETSPVTQDTPMPDDEAPLSSEEKTFMQNIIDGTITLRGRLGSLNVVRLLSSPRICAEIRKDPETLEEVFLPKLINALGQNLLWKFHWLHADVNRKTGGKRYPLYKKLNFSRLRFTAYIPQWETT